MDFALPLLLSLPAAWQTSPPPALAPVPVSVGSPPVLGASCVASRGRSGWLAKRVGRPAKRVGSWCGVPFVLLSLAHLASLPGVSSLASPPPPSARLQLTGPCSFTDGGSCAASSNYPNIYGNYEKCIISGVPPVGLEVVGFEVEGSSGCFFDYLTINGTKYCGTSGPQGVVAEDGVIEWRSDAVDVRSGWKARPGSLALPCFASLMPLLPLPLDLLGDSAAFATSTAALPAFTAFTAFAAFAAFTASTAASTADLAAVAAFTASTASIAVPPATTASTASTAALPATTAAGPAAAADPRLCRRGERG